MYGFFKKIISKHLPRFNCVVNPIPNAKNRIHIKIWWLTCSHSAIFAKTQCTTIKNMVYHAGLPPNYFDSFCSNPKNDTGLPVIYIVNGVCTWLCWHKIPVLSPLKLIIFVNIVLNWNNRSVFQLSKHVQSNVEEKT